MATHGEASVLETRRYTADEILQGTLENARTELSRSIVKLGFSGVAGGITMGLTALGVSSIRAFVGDGGWRDLVAYLAYPLGFIAVIIGRAGCSPRTRSIRWCSCWTSEDISSGCCVSGERCSCRISLEP